MIEWFCYVIKVMRQGDKDGIKTAIGVIALIWAALVFQGCNKSRNFDTAQFRGDIFQVNSASFKEKTPAFYAHTDAAKEIFFFVVKVDGQMYSYFDICNSCKQHNRGYRADKSSLECRNCQIEIPYEDLKTGIGGCYPIPIAGKEENGIYSIPLSEILKGRQFFP
ncbi:Fe-S-containing protein [Candidatus Magnetominusculus dajiuhuensis]|uniref:Fe-S-containing protein n=1 Tax=Candidatus Magnetominusculus dajiuhuensis TaxID=3137712 RepID=UPI003B431817